MIRPTAKTRGSGIQRALAFSLLLLGFAAPPAAAQSDDAYYGPYAGTSWSLRKVTAKSASGGECTLVMNHGAFGLDAAGTRFVKERDSQGGVVTLEWTGACDANGLISGRGTLYFDLDESADFISKRFIGTADRGMLNGLVGYNPYYEIEAEEYDALDPDQPVRFINGCNSWNGARPDSCDASRGDRLRGQYLAAHGAAPSKQVAAKPAAITPVPIPPSEPERSAETTALNAQQNAAAAAWLESDTEAKRIQAEKVADFERKQAEFDRQQAEYARQQADYKAALAAQQAEVARINQANADAQACYKGDKSRCK